ncbi:MAG: alkaline shock response membrane anchor protein AmaP [Paenibacillaceae bacterium]|nr:alkaline shock response membrane anchor protein AmaP [Paenibacillaceae bacterium]
MMHGVRRFTGAVCAVVSLVGACGAFVLSMPWANALPLAQWFALWQTDWVWGVRIGAVGVAVFALVLLIASVMGKGERIAEGLTQQTAYGDVTISLATIESLCLREAMRTKAMHEWRAHVRAREQGLEITLHATVDGDRAIPALAEHVQQTVKQTIERIAGVPVARVTVRIANMTKMRLTVHPTEKV